MAPFTSKGFEITAASCLVQTEVMRLRQTRTSFSSTIYSLLLTRQSLKRHKRWRSVQFRLYSVSVLLCGVSRVHDLRQPFPLVYSVRHAAVFAVNAALAANAALVNVNIAREQFPCTHPTTPSM